MPPRGKKKTVIPIPLNFDVAPYKKSWGCVEALPVPILEIIRDFAHEQDYRNLMNTNLSGFQLVKSETIYYSLSPLLFNSRTYGKKYMLESLQQIINNVKDKSKQIFIQLNSTNPSTIENYIPLFSGIHRLRISNTVFNQEVSYSAVFQDIHILELTGVRGINTLPLGLGNIHQLSVHKCGFTVIENLNKPKKSLKELKISRCFALVSIVPNLDDISSIFIDCPYSPLTALSLPLNCESCELVVPSISFDSLLTTESANAILHSMTKLKLRCRSPVNLPDFSIFQNISNLEFKFTQLPIYRLFPNTFNGHELYLYHFELTSWNSQSSHFPFLKVLRLRRCITLSELPEMPQIEMLQLEECAQLQRIRSFPSLKKLYVLSALEMHEISLSPLLETVAIHKCPCLNDITSFAHVKKLEIAVCNFITTVPAEFNRIPHLTIGQMTQFAHLENLSGNEEEDYQVQNRIVRLSLINSAENFLFCKNIYQLELHNFSQLITCEGIQRIHHLKISICPNLMSTRGIGLISGSLSITACRSLAELVNLKNIPVVTLDMCPAMEKFEGLGNHDKLTVNTNPIFSGRFRRYQTHKSFKKLFDTIQQLFIDDELVFERNPEDQEVE
jgi:hypothetical protein